MRSSGYTKRRKSDIIHSLHLHDTGDNTMNLLSILLKSLLTSGALNALAKKTGLNAK